MGDLTMAKSTSSEAGGGGARHRFRSRRRASRRRAAPGSPVCGITGAANGADVLATPALLDSDLESLALELELAELVLAHHDPGCD